MKKLVTAVAVCLITACSGNGGNTGGSGGGGSTASGGGANGGGSGGGGGDAQNLPDPDKSTITFSPASPIVGSTQMLAVTVTARNAASQPLLGVMVSLSMSGTGNTIPQQQQTTANGESTTMVWSTKAEVKTLSAQAGGITLTAHPTVEFVAGPINGFAFVVQPTAVKAGATITPAPQLQFQDQYGNPTGTGTPPAVSVRLTYNSSDGVLGGATTEVSIDGGLIFPMLTVSRPQTGYALRAETAAGGADESAMFDVTVGDVAMSTSTFTAMPSVLTANGIAATTLTVTLHDIAGNIIGGQSVTVSSSGSGNTLDAGTGVSDGAGVFTTTLQSTVAEQKTLTATSGGTSLTTLVTFTP